MKLKISSKYQVVIPRHVRKLMSLTVGTEVDVIAKGKVIYIVPLRSLEDIQKNLTGKLDQKKLRDKKDRL